MDNTLVKRLTDIAFDTLVNDTKWLVEDECLHI